MGLWRTDPNAYKKWSTYDRSKDLPAAAKAVAKSTGLSKKQADRYDYALRLFGRAAVRRPLDPNASDADKIKHLLGRANEDDRLNQRDRQARARAGATRTVLEAQRNMARGGRSINSAQDAIRDAFSTGW